MVYIFVNMGVGGAPWANLHERSSGVFEAIAGSLISETFHREPGHLKHWLRLVDIRCCLSYVEFKSSKYFIFSSIL